MFVRPCRSATIRTRLDVFVVGVYALANLWYIPSTVASRVSSLLASQMRGSVLERGGWVVPDPTD